MASVAAALERASIPSWECSFTALDAYLGVEPPPLRFIAVEAGLVELSKAVEGLEYLGLPYAAASLPGPEGRIHFRCVDGRFASDEQPPRFAPLDLFRVPGTRRFADPRCVRESLRADLLEPRGEGPEDLFEAASLLSRYDYRLPDDWLPAAPAEIDIEAQRDLLTLILTGAHPERGLEFLRRTGFVAKHWPELALLPGTSQSKEHHPEGDAWDHTLETFRHRKLPALALSLALLLHDTGKPESVSEGGRRFAGHSEIGSGIAYRFARRLGFDDAICDTVRYLVRWHMLPAALPGLPPSRVREALGDPRFALLLELYRCDELSTYRGPDGYYYACAAYREWLSNAKNPYRDEEGRKLARIYVEAAPPSLRRAGPAGRKRR